MNFYEKLIRLKRKIESIGKIKRKDKEDNLLFINSSQVLPEPLTKEEEERLDKAISIMEQFADNLTLIKIPNPTIELVKTMVRENCLTRNISYVFYDYIFIGPALLNEFRGFSLRNDKILSYI